ncbi:hypothetical protein H6S82_00095 [Planktothrix sp. FACHB-1355]|uniref:Uncharacterized protein n=1 Tax=Aerosakkonema funiforme FACHB-1375 TaxID=2949571 RepID=A0A926ZG63_9CYAN|nr:MULTISPECIES: hypothetical protein [Oscillatoriales]MBD2181853.1 hypothetical protein [Aerosakkonema funiforme FACHB-1375]MBD3557273.1 hypothetical protein [Planktothrix sp. FACHB-1355]
MLIARLIRVFNSVGFKRFGQCCLGFILAFVFGGLFFPSTAQFPPASVPGAAIEIATFKNAAIPDWSQISFGSLPGALSDGGFTVPPDIVSQLGFDPSRTWAAGQKPDTFLGLGDFEESFYLQKFNLATIAQLVSLDLSKFKLSDFGAIKFQSIASLVKAIPTLKNFKIGEVLPINDLLAASLTQGFNPSETIAQLLQKSPILGELSLNDIPLEAYPLSDSIPELPNTALGSFKDWERVLIKEVPGLSNVPFSQFPNPIQAVGSTVGLVDVAFGTAEQERNRTISGSDRQGFSVKCDRDCAHIELAGDETVLGKQWISGKYQQVKGGHGVLARVNNGKEPTGRHPFGNAFKVAIWEVKETTGEASQALFFRMCMKFLGCTPYFIGPIPWLTYQEKMPIFLGLIEPSTSNSVSTSTGATPPQLESTANNSRYQQKDSFQIPSATSGNLGFLIKEIADCKVTHNGVVLDALSKAISSLEGDYTSVGSYSCDRAGNCGRGLGSKQFMSYRSDVRSLIAAKPGGTEFLSRLDGGNLITPDELMQYFSPQEQEDLFRSDARVLLDRATSTIDPQTGQLFTGSRLIERVGQMHFGGSSIPIDAQASDVFGQLTVKSYGQKTEANYEQALQSMGCL